MSFLNPLFLFALVAVAVPVLIYLLNLRKPRRIRFSTLSFFDSLKQSALRRIRIKNWLLLSLRILAIAALAFAVSGPLFFGTPGFSTSDGPRAVAILIDNSPSMERISREGPYIEQALTLANELLQELETRDAVIVERTNGATIGLPFQSSEAAQLQLRMIETTNAGNYTKDRLRRLKELLNERDEVGKVIWFITDGQATQLQELQGEGDIEEEIFFQLLKLEGAETANASIESVSLEQGSDPGMQLQLRVQIRNTGELRLNNTFISFYSDEELITQQPFAVDPGSSVEFLFEVPPSEQSVVAAELRVEGDELTFDNHYYGAVHLPGRRRVLMLSDEDARAETFRSFLRPMLEIASEEGTRLEVEFADPGQLDMSTLDDADAIILDGIRSVPDYLSEALIAQVQQGKGLLLLPAARGSISEYNRLLALAGSPGYGTITGSYGSFATTNRMAPPEGSHPVIEGIFEADESDAIRLNVPEFFYYFEIISSRRVADQPVLTLRTGEALLMETRVGNGRILYSAAGSDPGWSNFPLKPFFAPLFYNAITWLAGSERAELLTHPLGTPFRFEQRGGSDTPFLQKGEERILPETRQLFHGREISYEGREWTPGWLQMDPEGENILIGVNFDTMESDFQSLTERELNRLFSTHFSSVLPKLSSLGGSESFGSLRQAAFGKEIWYWFVFIAIILLLLETILSKLYKTESI